MQRHTEFSDHAWPIALLIVGLENR